MSASVNQAFQDDDNKLIHHRHHNDLYNDKHPNHDQDFKSVDLIGDSKKDQTFDAGFDAPRLEPHHKSFGERWRAYPKRVFFIVGNEFCERFSYYGMRAVLVLYLLNILKFTSNEAVAINSGFAMLAYFSPILGSILADGFFGKFYTIIFVSLFYAAGNVTLAVAASFPIGSTVHPWLDFLGLIIIGLGTGGIKPCVLPFGGDQFQKGQERELEQFFSVFYFSINAGSTLSIILTPIFRTMPCQNQSTCYPLAFGVPAALMVIAVMFFLFGSFWYRKPPPEGNVFAQVAKVACTAVNNKRIFEVKRQHWLDHYMDSHYCNYDDECNGKATCQKAQFVEDIKALLRVLVVYVPLPIFWALYDQQGSTWVLQGTEMNSQLVEGFNLLPDQMGVVNAVLILILIPTFQILIYPLVGKCITLTPLRKMSVGGLLAGVAYIVCMLNQFQIEPTLPKLPGNGQTLLTVTNYVDACKDIRFVATHGEDVVIDKVIKANEYETFPLTFPNEQIIFDVDHGTEKCQWVDENKGHLQQPAIKLTPDMAGYVIFTNDNTDLQLHKTRTEKSQAGEILFIINVNYYVNGDQKNVTLCKGVTENCNRQPNKYADFVIKSRTSDYAELAIGTWGVFIGDSNKAIGEFTKKENGGIYSLTLVSAAGDKITMQTMQLASDNTVSILWQLPQYFVISVAEILFSITGNEFAYSQAPLSMKSIVMALWLLTISVGNTIILIISTVSTAGFSMAYLFLIYAGLMFVVMILFIFIAHRYKYSYYVRDDK